ncbi:Protein of unknown function [Lutibacter oricola]|uniref:Uncharacterized protein n=1 Tax=Lutibacter oricola TaxID=762486 RepID=A0A1H2RSY1_9FLAO|nr:DUF3179 domain-containing (seleno)protein [Lutibacter oricola]SDW22415.1 Protein of unknown function [Lutibacter oricola]
MKLLNVFFIILFISCSESNSNEFSETIQPKEWAVPLNDLVGDLNPYELVVNPTLKSISNINLNDNAEVIIVSINNTTKIYPLTSIHQYECINDIIDSEKYIVTFCPKTNSTIVIKANISNKPITLRASGILYKENLVLFDENSNSYWSQMLLYGIKGTYTNESFTIAPFLETTWKTAKTYFPDALVFSNSNNKQSKNLNSISNSEKVFGVINNTVKTSNVSIFKYSDFGDEIKIYNSSITNNTKIIGSQKLNFITSYSNENTFNFTPILNEFPIIMKDEFGNKWNVFGKAVSGPNIGTQLKPSISFNAEWWAWKNFYDDFNFIE